MSHLQKEIIFILLLLGGVHYLFDFLLQSRKMAENKSSSIKYLSLHVGIYTVGLGIIAYALHRPDYRILPYPVLWVIVNSVAHWVVDFVTSRLSASAYKDGEIKRFWSIIGLDQWLHHSILIVSTFGLYHPPQ